MAGLLDLLGRTLGETIHVETVLAGGLWRVFADENQLENALLNLAVNARDAMPGGGRLTIETQNVRLDEAYARTQEDLRPGDYVLVSVSDTGIGMTKEVLARAFDPFFTTKDIGQGTGLGLSQVYGFVRQSGGHVRIDSAPGQGASIKLYLPRFFELETLETPAADTAAGAAGQPARDDPGGRGRGRRPQLHPRHTARAWLRGARGVQRPRGAARLGDQSRPAPAVHRYRAARAG